MLLKSTLTIGFFLFNAPTMPLYAVAQKQIRGELSHAELDYAILEVNGDRRVVKNGETVAVVRGDILKIIDAFDLKGVKAKVVNFVGFSPKNPVIRGEDRGYPIKTSIELIKKWSSNGDGKSYRIVAKVGVEEIGKVTVEVIEPEVSYALIKVNGQDTVAKPGKFLYLKADDMLKVDRVVTNIENDDTNVKVKMLEVPMNTTDADANYRLFELRFYREDMMIARIPLQIENK